MIAKYVYILQLHSSWRNIKWQWWNFTINSGEIRSQLVLSTRAPTVLTKWGWVTHICVSKLSMGWDKSLSPGRRRIIILTNAGILSIEQNYVKSYKTAYILIKENAFENAVCEMAVILSTPQCANIIDASNSIMLLIQRAHLIKHSK